MRLVAGDTVPAMLAASSQTPWMAFAEQEIGQSETPGQDSNPRIVEYLRESGVTDANEATPWNGAFANWAVRRAGYVGPDKPLMARSWLTWGQSVPLTPGCVAVFWRGAPNGFMGHVAFFVGEEGSSLKILGGNQSNAVGIARIDRSRLLSCRMPNPADRLT